MSTSVRVCHAALPLLRMCGDAAHHAGSRLHAHQHLRDAPHARAVLAGLPVYDRILCVDEHRLEQQQVVELVLRDAAEPGSVTRTDSVLRLAARACRARPPFAAR